MPLRAASIISLSFLFPDLTTLQAVGTQTSEITSVSCKIGSPKSRTLQIWPRPHSQNNWPYGENIVENRGFLQSKFPENSSRMQGVVQPKKSRCTTLNNGGVGFPFAAVESNSNFENHSSELRFYVISTHLSGNIKPYLNVWYRHIPTLHLAQKHRTAKRVGHTSGGFAVISSMSTFNFIESWECPSFRRWKKGKSHSPLSRDSASCHCRLPYDTELIGSFTSKNTLIVGSCVRSFGSQVEIWSKFNSSEIKAEKIRPTLW